MNTKLIIGPATGGRIFLLSSGSDAIKYAIDALDLSLSNEVLLPSYLCKSVLRSFLNENVKVRFYRIDESMRADINDIRQKLSINTKAIFIIHFFGFPQPLEEIKDLCKENSIILIEDCAQSFLTKYQGDFLGSFGDISFNSYVKLLPIPDGAALIINNTNISRAPITRKSLRHFLYVISRCLFLVFIGLHFRISTIFPSCLYEKFYVLSEGVFKKYPKPAKISWLSKQLITRYNVDSSIKWRRDNFECLLKGIPKNKIRIMFKALPDDICPMGFPILLEERDALKEMLIRKEIQPMILWELPDEIDKLEFEKSWHISNHILLIPVDERYNQKDMKNIIELLRSWENSL